MKLKLTEEQMNLLRRLSQGTEYEKNVAMFSSDEFEIDDDLADELRDLCAEREIYMAQNRAEGDLSEDKDGELAAELVDLLYS